MKQEKTQKKTEDKVQSKTQEKAKNKMLVLVIICALLLVLVILAGVAVALLLGKEEEPDTGNVYVMEEGNYTQIAEQMEAEVNEGYFETYMNTEWTFQDGTSETQDAVLGNSPNNTKPIRCEVLLEDTGEKVFSTNVIPVGAQLPPFKLDTDLDAGVYSALCMIYLLDEAEDGTYKDYSSAGFYVTITVEN